MITICNKNRLTNLPFFHQLIDYLQTHDDVSLRNIHKEFVSVKNLDRQLEKFIEANLVWRREKRYGNNFLVFDDSDFELSKLMEATPQINQFEQPFFVKSGSQIEKRLNESIQFQNLSNTRNNMVLHFSSRYDLTSHTLANYFRKISENFQLSEQEQEIYNLMGDVDPDYALKYMTTFLFKFVDKETVKMRSDIFIEVLEKYNYIQRVSRDEYKCMLKFDEEIKMKLLIFDEPKDFITAQIKQNKTLENYISF